MSNDQKHTITMVILLALLIAFWSLVFIFFITAMGDIMKEARASETTMTATVVESEMRNCIESCGYKFK